MKNSFTHGFSVIEFLLAIAIATVICFATVVFLRNILHISAEADSRMTAVLESRKILRVVISELRSTIPSALGSYPIESASTSTITFFADVDFDDVADRVRYFLNPVTGSLERGVVVASGNPPNYNAPETFTTIVSGVVNSAVLPIFEYYDETYTGSEAPLSIPVNITAIRLVKVTVDIRKDPRQTDTVLMTSQASLRNLKE